MLTFTSTTSYAAVKDNVGTGFDNYENMVIEATDVSEDGDYALIGIPNDGLYNTNSKLKVEKKIVQEQILSGEVFQMLDTRSDEVLHDVPIVYNTSDYYFDKIDDYTIKAKQNLTIKITYSAFNSSGGTIYAYYYLNDTKTTLSANLYKEITLTLNEGDTLSFKFKNRNNGYGNVFNAFIVVQY